MKTNAFARLCLGAFLCCAAGAPRAESPAKPAPPAPAEASPVLLPATAQPVRAQLKPRQSTLIASNMTGRISTLEVRDGDRFQKSQVLAGFDCAEEKSRLARAEATQAKKEKQYEINQQLNRLKSVSVLEVEIAAAEVKESTAETQVMRAVASKCTINAPFAGRVAERIARPNQTVREGDPLLEILDDSEMEIEFVAPSRWLSWLKSGYPFAIAIDETGRSYPAEVVRKAGAVDPVSQSIKVYGRITQKAAELMAGMSGTVHIDPPKPPEIAKPLEISKP
jgi:membrane fusion protein (multidrug efflux system)